MLVACTTLYGEKKNIPSEKLFFRPAAYAVIIDGGKILLMKARMTGKYWFPGGSVEVGEKLEDALRREVREEAGIEIKVEKFLTFREVFFYHDQRDEAYQNFSFFYICKAKTAGLIADDKVDDDAVEKPRWVEIKSIKKDELQPGVKEILDLL